MLIAAAVVEGLVDHRRSGTSLGPLPHLAIRRLDDLAYGWGVWRGALRRGTTAPLRPRLAVRLVSRWTAGGRP
ncbi:hypothetical protein [Streptomyces sp. NPDC014006]|uniref:hypothetical protein n=1 Tax=Streptomyces sp. NPDC014006 TaxID=3364870 RepID=UPI003700985A